MKRFYLSKTSQTYEGKPLFRVMYLPTRKGGKQIKGGLVHGEHNIKDNAFIEESSMVVGDSYACGESNILNSTLINSQVTSGDINNCTLIRSKVTNCTSITGCLITNFHIASFNLIMYNCKLAGKGGTIGGEGLVIQNITTEHRLDIGAKHCAIMNINGLSGVWDRVPNSITCPVLGHVQETMKGRFKIFGVEATLETHIKSFYEKGVHSKLNKKRRQAVRRFQKIIALTVHD